MDRVYGCNDSFKPKIPYDVTSSSTGLLRWRFLVPYFVLYFYVLFSVISPNSFEHQGLQFVLLLFYM